MNGIYCPKTGKTCQLTGCNETSRACLSNITPLLKRALYGNPTQEEIMEQFKAGGKKIAYPEQDLHLSVVEHLRICYPHLLIHHSPNERKSRGFTNKKGKFIPTEAIRLKKLGTATGFPDLLIFTGTVKGFDEFKLPWTINGIFCEFKIRPNKPTIQQIKIMKQLESVGWVGGVFYDFESCKIFFERYLKK